MKSKIIIYALMFLLILSVAFAGDIGTVNQSMSLYADAIATNAYFPTAQATITIRNSSGSVLVNNASMTALVQGLYIYNFTPQTSGVHYTISTFYNSTDIIGLASSTFYVESPQPIEADNMTGIGVILALGIAIAIFGYMAFAFKSENNGTNAVWKVLSLIIVMLLLVLLAWTAIDSNQACAYVATSTGHDYICQDGPATAGSNFLKIMLVVMTIFFAWISVSLFISSLDMLRKTGKL